MENRVNALIKGPQTWNRRIRRQGFNGLTPLPRVSQSFQKNSNFGGCNGEATKITSYLANFWKQVSSLWGSSHVRESKSCLVGEPRQILLNISWLGHHAPGSLPERGCTYRRHWAAPFPGAWDRAPSIGNARQGSGDSSPTSEQDTEDDGSLLPSTRIVHPIPVRLGQELVSLT